LNKEILSEDVGGHPDYADILVALSKTLPQDMTDMVAIPTGNAVLERFPNNDDRFLAHDGIIFAAHRSMSIVMRLPYPCCAEALNSGAKPAHPAWKLSPEWVDVTLMEDSERRRWTQVAYQYAAELAKRPIV
jgi:hypothetical protein